MNPVKIEYVDDSFDRQSEAGNRLAVRDPSAVMPVSTPVTNEWEIVDVLLNRKKYPLIRCQNGFMTVNLTMLSSSKKHVTWRCNDRKCNGKHLIMVCCFIDRRSSYFVAESRSVRDSQK